MEFNFSKNYAQKDILQLLLNSGFSLPYDGKIHYVQPGNFELFNWASINEDEFDLNSFLDSHYDDENIGILLMISDSDGMDILIYDDHLLIGFIDDGLYISEQQKIYDYSWYIEYFSNFFQRVGIEKIKCTLTQ